MYDIYDLPIPDAQKLLNNKLFLFEYTLDLTS